MWGRRRVTPSVDLAALPPELRAVVEAAVSGGEVTVRRGDHHLGVLVFRSAVVEGVVVEAPRLPLPEVDVPEGVLTRSAPSCSGSSGHVFRPAGSS